MFFFSLGLLKIGASSVSKNWPTSGLLSCWALGLLSGPSSFIFSAFALVPAMAPVRFP